MGVEISDFEGKKKKDCDIHYSSSDTKKENDECIVYKTYEDDYNYFFKQLQVCEDSNCKLKANKEIKKIKEHWKSSCKSILEYRSYVDADKCVIKCLGLGDYLAEKFESSDGDCGFSWNLINFIANIIKWVKYIIPVVAIVLSILEFIKAVGADKDDEMKKAQGNFVKRMIAAALIFIVPVIIEFVLDAMGFNVNGCGIIDL